MVAVVRAYQPEIALVKREDTGKVEPFGNGDHRSL